MGFIRGALVVLASTIFFFAVLSSAVFFTIGSSLDYSTVQNKTVDLAGHITEQINLTQMIGSKLSIAKTYCKTGQNYVFKSGDYNFRLSCEGINQSISSLLGNIMKNFVSDSYYEEYNCKFLDCFGKYPITFLVSAKIQAYCYKLFYFSLTALALSAAALALLMKKRRHLPFVAGGLIILSSLIILGISKLLKVLPNKLVSEIIGIFFSKAGSVFIIMIIIAAIILLAGLVIEFYRAGFKLYNLFSKLEKPKESAGNDKPQKTADTKKK